MLGRLGCHTVANLVACCHLSGDWQVHAQMPTSQKLEAVSETWAMVQHVIQSFIFQSQSPCPRAVRFYGTRRNSKHCSTVPLLAPTKAHAIFYSA